MATSEHPEETGESGGQMTFFEHLVELRKRLINSLYAVGIGTMVGIYFSKYFVGWINRPILKALADAHLDPSSSTRIRLAASISSSQSVFT